MKKMLCSVVARLRDWIRQSYNRVREILRDYDHEWQELISSVALLAWGGSLAVPGFHQFESAAYTAMRQLMPQWLWALCLLLVGWLKLHGLMVESTPLRRALAFVGALVWLFTSIMIARADPRFPTVVIAPILAVSAAASYLRLSRRKG